MQGASRNWKRQEERFFPRDSRRNTDLPSHCRILTCRMVRGGNVLLEAIKFVIICYSSLRNLIHMQNMRGCLPLAT